MLQSPSQNGVLAKLTSHIPSAQFSRYLLVGLWNTAFGYGTYAGFTALLTPHIPHAYIVASVVANLLTITGAFLAYKWFVFKTKGKLFARMAALRGRLRRGSVARNFAAAGIGVCSASPHPLRCLSAIHRRAALLGLSAIISFLGHKNFSFAGSRSVRD